MKTAIIYDPQQQKLENMAQELGNALKQEGHSVEYHHIARMDRPLNVGKYDVVYLGSVTKGVFGTKIPVEISEFIRQCRGFQSVKSAAFIPWRIVGTTKGLRTLMAVLEQAGSQVMDFEVVKNADDAKALASRLK